MAMTSIRLLCRSVEEARNTVLRSRAIIAQSRRERDKIEAVVRGTRSVLAASREVLERR